MKIFRDCLPRHTHRAVHAGDPPGRGVEAGIDEAGRGPVLGPLVVAGIATANHARLADLGCRDSKKLAPARRQRIHRMLLDDPEIVVAVRVLEAHELDARMANESLNDIEAALFGEVASELVAAGAKRVVADAADVDADRFGRKLSAALPTQVDVVAQHKADDRHLVVAAASIIAKVTRDQAVADLARRLERKLGMRMGSGYPGDAATRAFLAAWVERFGDVPEGSRRSWKTVARLLAPPTRRLDEFGN